MAKRERTYTVIVYLAGPYRSRLGFLGTMIHVIKARRAAKDLWGKGYIVICPHSNTAFFDRAAPATAFLDGYVKILRHCDALFLLPRWDNSAGTRIEIMTATEMGIPIYMYVPGHPEGGQRIWSLSV